MLSLHQIPWACSLKEFDSDKLAGTIVTKGLFMDATCIGVIFDCDGTLIDSMGVWRDLEAELAQRAGITLTEEDVDHLTTYTIPECGAFFHEQHGLGASGADVVDMINDFMLDFYQTRAQARPGALEFVKDLAESGIHVSVASSSPQAFLQAGMKFCGFTPYLDAIVSVDDVGRPKREPAVYDRARELMGTPLETTWGVEDALYAIRTLNGANYRSLGIYDCDLSGTQEQLVQESDQMILTFEGLDAKTLIKWTRG